MQYCREHGLTWEHKVYSDAFYLCWHHSWNDTKWKLVATAIPVGPILYVAYGLWRDGSGGYDDYRGYFGETNIWVDYPNQAIYKGYQYLVDLIDKHFDHNPGFPIPSTIVTHDHYDYPFSDEWGCSFFILRAGIYSKELLERALDIEGFDVKAMVERAMANEMAHDWLPEIEGLYLQENLSKRWIMGNYRRLNHNYHYVRPHSKEEGLKEE